MRISKTNNKGKYVSASSEELNKVAGGPLTFGRMLWAWRQCEEASLQVFALRLGISKQHLSDLEKEKKFASPGRAAHYALILKLPPHLAVQLTLQDLVRRDGLKYEVKVA